VASGDDMSDGFMRRGEDFDAPCVHCVVGVRYGYTMANDRGCRFVSLRWCGEYALSPSSCGCVRFRRRLRHARSGGTAQCHTPDENSFKSSGA
jgi:hypothetical protein